MIQDDRRLDPDEVLERLQIAEQQARRGKLKIFFGASPGVGKTYAMLLEARRLRAQRRAQRGSDRRGRKGDQALRAPRPWKRKASACSRRTPCNAA